MTVTRCLAETTQGEDVFELVVLQGFSLSWWEQLRPWSRREYTVETPLGRTRRQARARSGYNLQKPDSCDLLLDRSNFPDSITFKAVSQLGTKCSIQEFMGSYQIQPLTCDILGKIWVDTKEM